ncbi:hypothetical protein HDE_09370 [Halotydeus destructor]|nr:hypothetical protein HDE_09370 [Halotydeus destructor]
MAIGWRRVNAVKKEFNDLFSIFPVLWFYSIFLKSSGTITKASSVAHSYYSIIYQTLGFEVLIIFTVVYVIALADNHVSRLVDEYIEAKMLTSSLNDISKLFLADELRRKASMTALFLFELNGSLVLSFLGSLITFTVVFIQLP